MVETQQTGPEKYLELIRSELIPEKLYSYMRRYDEATNTAYYPALSSEVPIALGSREFSYTLTHGQPARANLDLFNGETGITELSVSVKDPTKPENEGAVIITVIGVVEHTVNTPPPLLDNYIVDVDPRREGLDDETNLAIYRSLLTLSSILKEKSNLSV